MRTINQWTTIAAAVSLFALSSARADQLIQNGGFEQKNKNHPTDGGLYLWSHTGTVTVQSDYELNGLAPTEVTPDSSVSGNNHFAVMSSGSGSEDSTLTQNPWIPPGFSQPVTLSFEFDLLAENTASNQRNEEQGSTLSLMIGGDTVFSEAFNDIYTGSALDAKGDSGQTGWQTVTLTLTSSEFTDIENNGVHFDFSVDQTDSKGFDFAAAIDNVSLTDPVPDSASTALLLGGVVSAIAFAKRKLS